MTDSRCTGKWRKNPRYAVLWRLRCRLIWRGSRCPAAVNVLRVPLVPFSFVLSFRLVVFRLLLASPSSLRCLPWWRILLFCYFVSALHPPRDPCEPEVCVFPLREVFFLALMMLTYLFLFSSLPSLFRFRFGHRLFSSCLFLVGTMLSPRFRFLLRLV